jgi:DNA polymerase-1
MEIVEVMHSLAGDANLTPELRDQLDVLPQFVGAHGFVCAKSPGYEADDLLAAAVANEELRGGMAIVATEDRDAFQLASELTTILQPVRAGEMARVGVPPGRATERIIAMTDARPRGRALPEKPQRL